MSTDLKIFGRHDDRTVEQLRRCVEAADGARGALMADGHLGYSMPIGGVVAYPEHVSPSGVGYDIGCGNKAVMTDLEFDQSFHLALPELMDEVVSRISFGMGRNNDEPVEHPILEAIARADFGPQRRLLQLARNQLGTVGAGNHYVDLFHDERMRVWVGVHFGSRGFGHKTASGFLALARGAAFGDRVNEGGMDAPPTLLRVGTELGDSYISAMELAGAYAYAGRDVVCDRVLEILGASAVREVHNHHNFAWHEYHDGDWYWVVRKGATPAKPGQEGFVGSTMGEQSVILEGTAGEAEHVQRQALFSTVHGAGRAMSRTEAAGKVRRRKTWQCADRDCDQPVDGPDGECPLHPGANARKVWVTERKTQGRIDYDEVRRGMAEQGIELRGGAADEAPGAYKRLGEVLAAQGDTIRVVHRLTPVGVAMAGPDTRDDYKD